MKAATLSGVNLDLAFFKRSILEYSNNSKEIKKIYLTLKKEFFHNEGIFEYIKHNIKVYNRVPEFLEIKEKFNIDLQQLEDAGRSIEYYLTKIKDRYLKKALKNFASSITNIENISERQIDELYRPALRLAEEFKSITEVEDLCVRNISDIADEAINVIDKSMQGDLRGIPAPWPTFQEVTGGVLPGEFVIIAGRPGTGKTWMLYKWAYFIAQQNKKVLLFNTEMSGVSTLIRLACLNTGLRVSSVRGGNLTVNEASILKSEITKIKSMSNFIITDIGFTPSLTNVIKSIKQFNPDMVFIDSAYLIRTDSNMSRTENASEVSDQLKSIAVSYGIPIVAAIQHNREAVKGAPSLATLSLTDSNAWNASFVMSIDPPPSPKQNAPISGSWKIHIIKNREGDLKEFFVSKSNYEETPGEEFDVFGHKIMWGK